MLQTRARNIVDQLLIDSALSSTLGTSPGSESRKTRSNTAAGAPIPLKMPTSDVPAPVATTRTAMIPT